MPAIPAAGGHREKRDRTSIEDYALPASIVTRITKSMLPACNNLQRDAVYALGDASTVFINHITSMANDQARAQNRKGINAKDVFKALEILEFEAFIPRLEAELNEYNEAESSKKTKKEDRINTSTAQKGQPKGDSDHLPATKKSKLDPKSTGAEPDEEDDAATDDAEEDEEDRIEDDDQVVSSESDDDAAQEDVDDLKSDDELGRAEEIDEAASGDESD